MCKPLSSPLLLPRSSSLKSELTQQVKKAAAAAETDSSPFFFPLALLRVEKVGEDGIMEEERQGKRREGKAGFTMN